MSSLAVTLFERWDYSDTRMTEENAIAGYHRFLVSDYSDTL